MKYYPVILFRAKCFAKTPIDVIFHKNYEALWDKPFKTQQGALNYAKRNIIEEDGIWQVPGAKEIIKVVE